MVGEIVISPIDANSQQTVGGSAQRVVVTRAQAPPRDAAVQHCFEFLGSKHPDFEFEGSTRSIAQFEGVCPTAISLGKKNSGGVIPFVTEMIK